MIMGLGLGGYRVEDHGFRTEGLGFRTGFRVSGLGLQV